MTTDVTYGLISSAVHHTVRTLSVHDDLVGWVMSGNKRLVGPGTDRAIATGHLFVIARGTQWDVINDPGRNGKYEARVLAFAPAAIEHFHRHFGEFAAQSPVRDATSLHCDPATTSTFNHLADALVQDGFSPTVRNHRAQELLLLLAERGAVFAPPGELNWTERTRRLMAQRPQVAWSVAQVATAFHVSVSTLQRRLSLENTTLSLCLREVRLESALGLLQGSSLQVSEIAARCGYASHSRFSAAFRQRFGFSPSHLRPNA